MRHHHHIFLFIVAFGAALACGREPSEGVVTGPVSEWSGASPRLVVGTATKTVLSDKTPVWTSDDVLTVFDADAAAVPFANVSGAGAVATFATQSWTGKTPVYVAFSGGEPACNVIGGLLTVTVPAEQAIADPGSFARQANPSIGTVSASGGGYTVSMLKNIAALLEFTFEEDSEITSVRIEGCSGETIAGKVSASVSDATARPLSSGAATSVILTPSGAAASGGGCFLGGVRYYAAVLPGTYSGLRLTMSDASGATLVKTIAEGTGLTLTRDRIFGFGQPIDYVRPETLPDEFIVSPEVTVSADGRIYLPRVKGRYLNSLVVIHEATGAKTIRLHKASDDSVIGTYVTHDWKHPVPVAKFSPHTTDRCYLTLAEPAEVTHIYLRYTSTASGSDAVKLGYESNYTPWNNVGSQGDGSVYTYDPDLFFSGIVGRRDPDGNWPADRVPDPYTFTQTVDGVVYTYESLRPNNWSSNLQRMWSWEAGLWSCDWGTPNALKLPRTGGKLVWVGVACKNAYNTTKNRQIGILAKGPGDADFETAGAYAFCASTAQGSGDGSTLENSTAWKVWIFGDESAADKDYYISCLAGSTSLSQMVLVYL